MQSDQPQNNLENNSNGHTASDKPLEMYKPSEAIEENTKPTDNYRQQANNEADDDLLARWNANEYTSGEKNGLWFVIFGIIVAGFIALDVFWFKSYTFSALVVVMAFAVIILSKRPPRAINYSLTGEGLYIDEKLYRFSEFRSFGVINDEGRHSILLVPVKRFAFGVTIYFPREAGEKIVDILGARLPMENLKLDFIDVLVRKLRL